MKRVKVLTLLLKVLTLLLLLCSVSVIGIACSGDGKLHIDAPTEIQAELGVYAVPKYDVVDEEGVVMAGYTVTLKSVKDESGNAVDISGGLTVKEPSIYYLEYTANSKKVPNVTVKVDFADRTPPEVNVDVADFPALFVKGREYSIPKFSFGAAPDLSKCWMKIYYKSAEGTKTEKELDGTYFKVTEDRGEYEFVFHGEDAAGNVNEVKHVVPVDGPNAFVENVAVYAEEFGTRQVDTSAKTKIEVANDASKGSTLKITLTGEQSGQNGANVVFQNVSPVRDYDYISFDIKSSVDGVYAGIMQYDGNGALNPFGAHYAAIGTSWKKVSFNVLQQGQFWWYDRDNRIGLYFMAGFASDATLAADTTFEITNIRLEKGNAQIANAEYNMLTYGAQYTFPKATDNHGVDHDGAHSDSTARDIEVAEVTKDGEEVALSGDKKSITFNATGEYTVYYKVDNTEYTYTVTVSANVDDIDLMYKPNVDSYTVSDLITVKNVKFNGSDVTCNGNTFTLNNGGDYVVTADAFGSETTFKVCYHKPTAVTENVAVYAEDFGTRQVDASAKTKIEVANDASKGSVLKITLTEAQSGQIGAYVVFENVSAVHDYDYISFDIKSSVNDVYVGIAQSNGTNFGGHFATIGSSWKKVSFNFLEQNQTWWYDGDGKFGLYFMAGFASDATLAVGTTFEITNICLEKGNALIASATHNIAKDGAQYTFPKATDTHGVDYEGEHFDSAARDIAVSKVMKDGEEVALSEDKKSITFNATGEYTVYYKVDNTEYTYVVTVINVPIEDVTLYYGASEEYALPTQTVGGKTISVSGVTSAGGMVSCESGKFSLTAGTVTTANDTNTYVYTVNYKVTGDETQYSYTVTYHKPSNVAENRMVYFDSNYGITHQLTVGNGTAVSDSKYKTDNSDRGTKSTKITVSESGAVWLRFTNVPWNTAYNNLDIAFSTSSVLRYAIYDANGNIVKEEVAFVESGNADRWSGIQFAASLDDKDMSSFSIKLFNAYNENEPLAAGTEIWIVGGLGYTF